MLKELRCVSCKKTTKEKPLIVNEKGAICLDCLKVHGKETFNELYNLLKTMEST